MNVGIITFHRAVNYGAILQTWALYYYLKQYGFNVFVIDYRCSYIEDNYKIFSLNLFKKKRVKGKVDYILSHLLKCYNIKNRNRKFVHFLMTHLNLLSIDDLNKLDVVIAGSDQIWNPYLTNGLDSYYTLKHKSFNNMKKIGYAISGEPSYYSDKILNDIGNVIKDIEAISVREITLKELFSNYCDKKIEVCVDPTLLIKKEVWESICERRIVKEKYIFVYQVVHSSLSLKIANDIACKNGLKIIYLNSKFSFQWREKNISTDIGPSEFLSLIKYADFVVTTSFHGTVLSLIMKKQFLVIKTGKMNRQLCLLESLNLTDRIIDRNLKTPIIPLINYDEVNLDKITENSSHFLKEYCYV